MQAFQSPVRWVATATPICRSSTKVTRLSIAVFSKPTNSAPTNVYGHGKATPAFLNSPTSAGIRRMATTSSLTIVCNTTTLCVTTICRKLPTTMMPKCCNTVPKCVSCVPSTGITSSTSMARLLTRKLLTTHSLLKSLAKKRSTRLFRNSRPSPAKAATRAKCFSTMQATTQTTAVPTRWLLTCCWLASTSMLRYTLAKHTGKKLPTMPTRQSTARIRLTLPKRTVSQLISNCSWATTAKMPTLVRKSYSQSVATAPHRAATAVQSIQLLRQPVRALPTVVLQARNGHVTALARHWC